MVTIQITKCPFSYNYIFETATLMQIQVQRTEKNSEVTFQFSNEQEFCKLLDILSALAFALKVDYCFAFKTI